MSKEFKYNDLIGHSKTIPSRWNSFRITYSFEVKCRSYKLGVWGLNEARTQRLELMLLLQDKYQMNCDEISDFLNSNNIKTHRNQIYNHKIVWSSIKKCKKRLDRFNNDKIIDVRERLFIEEL